MDKTLLDSDNHLAFQCSFTADVKDMLKTLP
jgi:hypothetical protein